MANENVGLTDKEKQDIHIEALRRRLDDYAKILRANGYKVTPPVR